MRKETKVYQIILVICALVIGALSCCVDHLNKEVTTLQQSCSTSEIGNDVENWILDVVYETDIFDDITEEENSYLDELMEESLGRYYVELIRLYEKYYGNK